MIIFTMSHFIKKNAVLFVHNHLFPNGAATYHPSRKLSKLDEPDMQDTAGEVGTNS